MESCTYIYINSLFFVSIYMPQRNTSPVAVRIYISHVHFNTFHFTGLFRWPRLVYQLLECIFFCLYYSKQLSNFASFIFLELQFWLWCQEKLGVFLFWKKKKLNFWIFCWETGCILIEFSMKMSQKSYSRSQNLCSQLLKSHFTPEAKLVWLPICSEHSHGFTFIL